jgi:hypothetical protein
MGKTTDGEPSGLKVTQADARPAVQSPSLASSVADQQSSASAGLSSLPPTSKPPTAQPPTDKFQESGLRSQAKTNGSSDAIDSERDSIAWLHQRIMTLQHERETRWQKILKLLPGAS